MRSTRSNLSSRRHTCHPSIHRALTITEILSSIFFYLDRDDIFSCRNVCKQWGSVGRLFLVLKDDWCESMPALEISLFMERLAWIDTVEIHYVQNDTHRQVNEYMSNLAEGKARGSWEFLARAMELRAVERKPGLRGLILNGGRGDVLTTFPITSSVETDNGTNDDNSLANSPLLRILGSSLSSLTLSSMQFGQLELNSLLECCPKLTNLSIEYDPLSEHVVWRVEPSSEQFRRQFPLQSLALRNIRMKQSSLMDFLGRCSGLRSLKILFMRSIPSTPIRSSYSSQNAEDFDGTAFFRSLKTSCSLIRKLHFSLSNRPLSSEELGALVECLPHLTTFGCSGLDLSDPVSGTKVLDHYSNHLTTLEIHSKKSRFPGPDGEPRKDVVAALHQFLCSSPNLLYLRAKNTIYHPSRYLDLTGRRSGDITRIWACRGLLTLQLTFDDLTTWEEWSEVNSRVLFGYISRACPKLRELWLFRPGISLLLEGGLCLLTRCKDLESLTIKTARMRGRASSQAMGMHEAARPDMLEVEWIADWIGNHPGLIERTKRNWKRSELIKRILNHDHGTSQRLDDICEACASERIHRLNGTSIQNPQSGSSIGNSMAPRSSIRLALSSGISFLSNGTAVENPPVSLQPLPEPLSSSIEVLSRVGDLQEIIDWMEEGPGFSSPSFECWPRLKSFTIGVHINYMNKTVWAWKRKSAVAVQQELRPEIGFKVELTSNNMGHLLWWRD